MKLDGIVESEVAVISYRRKQITDVTVHVYGLFVKDDLLAATARVIGADQKRVVHKAVSKATSQCAHLPLVTAKILEAIAQGTKNERLIVDRGFRDGVHPGMQFVVVGK